MKYTVRIAAHQKIKSSSVVFSDKENVLIYLDLGPTGIFQIGRGQTY
jgi:hypothetical protein